MTPVNDAKLAAPAAQAERRRQAEGRAADRRALPPDGAGSRHPAGDGQQELQKAGVEERDAATIAALLQGRQKASRVSRLDQVLSHLADGQLAEAESLASNLPDGDEKTEASKQVAATAAGTVRPAGQGGGRPPAVGRGPGGAAPAGGQAHQPGGRGRPAAPLAASATRPGRRDGRRRQRQAVLAARPGTTGRPGTPSPGPRAGRRGPRETGRRYTPGPRPRAVTPPHRPRPRSSTVVRDRGGQAAVAARPRLRAAAASGMGLQGRDRRSVGTVSLHWQAKPEAQVRLTRLAPVNEQVRVAAGSSSVQLRDLPDGIAQVFEAVAVYRGADGAELALIPRPSPPSRAARPSPTTRCGSPRRWPPGQTRSGPAGSRSTAPRSASCSRRAISPGRSAA